METAAPPHSSPSAGSVGNAVEAERQWRQHDSHVNSTHCLKSGTRLKPKGNGDLAIHRVTTSRFKRSRAGRTPKGNGDTFTRSRLSTYTPGAGGAERRKAMET